MPRQAGDLPFELIGASAAVRECVAQVERAAADDRGLLLAAERGLDVEAVARLVHGRSGRKSAPFVTGACDGVSPGELENFLFGARRRGRPTELELIGPSGALSRARGGVLFLNALHELPVPLQRRLARVLRDREVRTPRRAAAITLDVRVVAGIESDGPDVPVREELARRFPAMIDIPPLRRRREDVPAIAEAMLAVLDRSRRFTPAALTVLAALPWRRNTAELSRLIERLAAGQESPIRQEDVLAEVQLDRTPLRRAGNLREARRQFERDYIAAVLRDHEWHMPQAARALGIERANLYRKARQLGIPLRREPESVSTRMSR